MKYDVNHSCGHTQTHELFGPGSDRERKLAWLKTTLCSECYRAAKADAVSKAEQEAGVDLPEINGSEKQVAWARDIRSKWIAQMAATFAQGTTSEKANRIALRLAALVTDAREWIDSRGDSKAILKARREDYERIVKEETLGN